jgi:hypothetical protein
MEVVDALRHRRLDELVATGRDTDVASIIACAVNVLAEVVRAYPWGADYVLVVAQAVSNPRIELATTIDTQAISGHSRTAAMARKLLPALPHEKFNARMRIVLQETAHVFARWVNENGELTRANRNSFNTMVATVIEFMTAGLAAPVGEIERTEERRLAPLTPAQKRNKAATVRPRAIIARSW